MGFRFRKSIKIAPGVRLNLGKKSIGISAGVKGARVSVNSSGRVTKSVGIPGTGISYVKTSKIGGAGSGGGKEPPSSQPPLPASQPQPDKPNKPGGKMTLLKVLGILLIAFGLLLSIATIVGGLVFTAIGCIVLQRRSRMLEAAAGQTAVNPFRRRWQIVVTVAFVMLAAIGIMAPDQVNKISLSGLADKQLEVPEATSVVFQYQPADAPTDSITCVSSDPAVATAEITSIENGYVSCLVTPLSAGDVTITCQTNTVQGPELAMTVTDPAAEAAAKAEAERKAAEEEAARKAAEEEAARKAAEEEAARKAAEEAAAAQAEAERQAAEQAAAAQAAAEQQAAAAQTNSQMVYVTPTGKRYHYSASCAGKNATEATLQEAQNRGLTPCKKCAGG